MVRVLTVDDHAQFLEVARELIEATPGFEIAGEASAGEQALAALDEVSPDLVLADVHMPGMDGIELTRRIKERHPGTVVFLISAQEPAGLPRTSRSCGASAIVAKQELAPARLSRLWDEHGGAEAAAGDP